jgi:DNA primase
VAPLGTALTENQLELLWRMAPQPVLCFDGDKAGLKAAIAPPTGAAARSSPASRRALRCCPKARTPTIWWRAPFDKVMSQAKPLAEMIWSRELKTGTFETPESKAELEARLRQLVAVIADENVRRHYQQDMRDRLNGFFQPQFQNRGGGERRNFERGNFDRGSFDRGNGQSRGQNKGRGNEAPRGARVSGGGISRPAGTLRAGARSSGNACLARERTGADRHQPSGADAGRI